MKTMLWAHAAQQSTAAMTVMPSTKASVDPPETGADQTPHSKAAIR